MEINFLWIGDTLGKLEQLTLKSFMSFNHTANLWLYNLNCKNIPSGVNCLDAKLILPENKVFSYKGSGDCRPGSYGGFSDLFRYYILKSYGGWYCDMDVTCFKSFDYLDKQPYVIRPHKKIGIVGNIIKCPRNSPMIDECIYRTEKEIDATNSRWIKPVEILRDCIKDHNLQKYIVPNSYFGCDDIEDIRKLLSLGVFLDKKIIPEYAIHWCNEAISTGQWDLSIKRNFNNPLPTTLFYNLLKQHNLL